MYFVENKLLDSFFVEMFEKNKRSTHAMYVTGDQERLRHSNKNLNIVRRSIRYIGAITRNTIPSEIKNSKTGAILRFSKYLQQKY